MQTSSRVRRRDRHGRGLRGLLTPPDVPLHRSRSEQFGDLVLEAIARLEPRWEAELARVEFAVQEVPDREPPEGAADPVPLARLDLGPAGRGQRGGGGGSGSGLGSGPGPGPGPGAGEGAEPGDQGEEGEHDDLDAGPRIVLYRRALLARADDEEELAVLVLDVVIEEFARLLGVDPEVVDPGYEDE
ncbi:MAG TPA: metallopeptidase family protein [Streptosporangiaceae bacterium]